MIEEKQSPSNETTSQKECKSSLSLNYYERTKNIGQIYIIVGPGEFQERPYIRYVGKTISTLRDRLSKHMSNAKHEIESHQGVPSEQTKN